MAKTKEPLVLNVAYKYLECINTEVNDSRYWFGRRCTNFDVKVDQATATVVCGTCLAILTAPGDPAEKLEPGYIVGWRSHKEFVDWEGKVFFYGVEQEHLKGTLPFTVEEKKKEKVEKKNIFKTKKIKTEISKDSLEISKLKKLLKTEKNPTEQKEIIKRIKLIEKGK